MQKKHSLKMYAVSLASLGVAVLATSISHAAFSSVSSVTKNATAQLTGAGDVSMTVAVKKMSDNSAATDVAWTGVTLPTGWKNADHYVQLDHSITAANGGIRIVTDNKNSAPAYTGPNATAAGLVDNTNTANTLQVAWSIKDGIVGSTGPVSAKPFDAALDGAGQANQFQWLYMTDVVDTATLGQGAPYRTAVNASGIHFGGGDSEFGAAASPNYVYLEANFGTAVTPRTYSTSKLIVEAFTQ